jgi:hypothetical protein
LADKHQTNCPNCNFPIDVNDLLYQQLDKELKEKYTSELAQDRSELAKQLERLKDQEKTLKKSQQALDEQVQSEVKQQLEIEKTQLTTEVKAQLRNEHANQLADLEKELGIKSAQLSQFNQVKSEVERLKREKQELRSEIELEAEKKLNAELKLKTESIQQQLDEQSQQKIGERDEVIKQLKDQLAIAHQKAEQGSMQVQGESQEVIIETWLREQFPLDEIQEIKKGASGADTLQVIHTRSQMNCGSIYYESKNTKAFQPAWIEKFKQDIQAKNASTGVLVSQTLPTGQEGVAQIDGVWVCSIRDFKNLSKVLRESIVHLNQMSLSNENKGDKMTMMYDFLTGNEFRMQVESIVEGFTQLKQDLESEKRAMHNLWKKREKQIDRVLLNTNSMYGSIKGIAGNAIGQIDLLELDQELD